MIAREAMIDAAEAAIDNVHDMDVTLRGYAEASVDAIIAALPDMIEPLVWTETQSGYVCHHGYEIKADATSRNRYYVVGPLGLFVVSPISAQYQLNPMTGSEAKAAAEAHHRAQILAAFGVTL